MDTAQETESLDILWMCPMICAKFKHDCFRFQCVCLDGYEGALCETNTDDCVDHQCINGGVCVDDIAGYNCQCSEK